MNITELARKHHLSSAALRLYDRLGLFDDTHVQRQPNGYRDFLPAASDRVLLIRLGQSLGFSLKQMQTELRHWDDGGLSPVQKKAILRKQLEHIDRRLHELNATRQYIVQEIEKACEAE